MSNQSGDIGKRGSEHSVAVLERLTSVDAFRGATIVAMLLTTQGGGPYDNYEMFRHAEWVGWTFTDCVAPCFMWIVGVSLAISFDKRRIRGDSTRQLLIGLVRRSASIFAIGVALNFVQPAIEMDFGALVDIKIMGTLQRISLAYLLGGIVVISGVDRRGQLIAAGSFLVLYLAVVFLVTVPGFPRGNFNGEGNAIKLLDQVVLGSHSARSHPLLSTIPAAATVLLGSVIGHTLISKTSPVKKLQFMIFVGSLLFLGGNFLKHWIPIVMFIWTPSYCLVMAGIASVSYGILFWLLERRGLRSAVKPFVVFGMNPISIWIAAWILESLLHVKGVVGEDGQWRSLWTLAYQTLAGLFASPGQSSLAFALIWVSVFYIIAHLMWVKKWVVRI